MSNIDLDSISGSHQQHQNSLYSSFQNEFLKQGHYGDNEIIKFDFVHNSNNSPSQISQIEKQSLVDYAGIDQQHLDFNYPAMHSDQIIMSPVQLINLDSSPHKQNNQEEDLKFPKYENQNINENNFHQQNYSSGSIQLGILGNPSLSQNKQRPYSQHSYAISSLKDNSTINFEKPSLHLNYNEKMSSNEPDSMISANQNSILSPINAQNTKNSLLKKGEGFDFTHYRNSRYYQQTKKSSEMQGILLQNYKLEKAQKIIQQIKNTQINRINRINSIVKQFITNLMVYSGHYAVSNLSVHQFQQINDKSSFFKKQIKVSIFRKFKNTINQLISSCPLNFPLIQPTSMLRIIWDAVMVLFTVPLIMLYSILTFCASHEQIIYSFDYLLQASLIIFIVDVIINFNSAHFNKDVIVLDRKLIAIKYIQENCFPDIIAIMVIFFKLYLTELPLFYNPKDSYQQYLTNMLFLFKLKCIPSKMKKIDELLNTKESQKHKLRLLKLIIQIILIAHTKNNCGMKQTWMSAKGVTDDDWITKYVISFYWCITTMTTVGFGDIVPVNVYEYVFMIASMIFMSCIFAYTISNVGMILQEIEKNQRELNNNISNIQRYLNRKNVNISLKSRVRNYLVFLSEEQKDRNKEAEEHVFNKLSNKLRDELTVEINGKIINSYSILTNNFSAQTLNKIVFAMKECLVAPNEIIFQEGQVDDHSIYFIQNGYIDIYNHRLESENKQSQQTMVKRLGQNSVFGELSFFTKLPRKAGAKSVNLATLYKLSLDDFMKILSQNKEDFERYKMISEQILIEQDLKSINIECYSCHKIGHIASQCSYLHFSKKQHFISLRDNFSVPHIRMKNFNAKPRVQYHPRQLLEINKSIHQKLKEECQNMDSHIRLMFTNISKESESSRSSMSSDSQSDNQQSNNMQESTKKTSLYTSSHTNRKSLTNQAKLSLQTDGIYKSLVGSKLYIQNDDGTSNEMKISKEDLFHLLHGRMKTLSPSISSLKNNTKKQKSLQDKNKHNEKQEIEGQITEVDEDASVISIKEHENIAKQTATKQFQENYKKHQSQAKKGSRDSLKMANVESEQMLFSLLSQEIPILSPKTLSINNIEPKHQIYDNLDKSITLNMTNDIRKSKKRFATLPPRSYQNTQNILFSQKQNTIEPKLTQAALGCLSPQFQSKQQIVSNLSSLSNSTGILEKEQKQKKNTINPDQGKRRHSKFILKLLGDKAHLLNDNQISSIPMFKSQDESQILTYLNQDNQNHQNINPLDLKQMLLLNQLGKRNNQVNDFLQQLDNQSFSKHYFKFTFETMQIFKRFYPHNNYNKVIQNIKLNSSNLRKQRKSRHQSTFKKQKMYIKLNQKEFQSNTSQKKNNPNDRESILNLEQGSACDLYYRPTYLSYGISTIKNFKLYPHNNLQIFQ